ncbi:MAG: hypothetical protein MJ108_03870 [Saccharofermentans sp.]|nr:hypothetical protein [Saccharofermentans sp.]
MIFQSDMAYEDIVKRDNGKMGRIVFPLVVTLALIFFIIIFLYLFTILDLFYIAGMASLGLCYLVYYKFKSFNNTEFEIEFINEYFSVAKVQRQKKRTELAEFSFRDCDYIGPTTESKFAECLENAAFKLNITSHRNYEISDKIWFCSVKGEGYNYIVIFEFKNPMYKFFRRFNPRNVYAMPMPKEEPDEFELNDEDNEEE